MNEHADLERERFNPEIAERLEALRKRFQIDWESGRQLVIEEYLSEIAIEHRPALRAELVALECALGGRAAESELDPMNSQLSAPAMIAAFSPSSIMAPPDPKSATPPTIAVDSAADSPRGSDKGARLDAEPTIDLTPLAHEMPTAAAPGEAKRKRARAAEPSFVRRFGDYEIIREIARGGMGVVFKARQVSLNRIVALKMILAGHLADGKDVRRFQTEAEAAAHLDHPGIVPVYEVGQHDGQHYFSMGFVDGQSLAQRLARGPFPSRDSAELMARVSDAIAYAHERGVIHRDLKPANILLDVDGYPRVTDFGLAKKIEDPSGITGTGTALGTPSYMPPEQARGRHEDVGPSADVYALGATLYRLLTGRPPFQAATPAQTVFQVISTEAVTPRRLNPAVDRDLETICMKCLQKDPPRRYTSAAALAADLRRYLAGEPILARPIANWERAMKWARRRPAIAALASALTLVTVGAFIVMAALWNRAERSARAARTNERIANDRALDLRRQVYVSQVNLAYEECQSNNVGRARELLESCPGDLRGWEWSFVNRQCHLDLHTFRETAPAVNDVDWSPDGRLVASGTGALLPNQDGVTGELVVRDADSGKEVFTRRGLRGGIRALEFSPDGRRIAIAYARQLAVWDLDTGKERFNITGPGALPIENLAFSPDGQRVIASYGSFNQGGVGLAQIVDASSGAQIGETIAGHENGVWGVAYSPDCRQVALTSADLIEIWDVGTRQSINSLRGHSGFIYAVTYSPDGKFLASGGMDTSVKLWNRATGQLVRSFLGHEGSVREVRFSRDSLQIASASEDKSIKIWSVSSDRERATLVGHEHFVHSVCFSPDGHRVASGSLDQTTKLWFAAPSLQLTFHGHDGWVNNVAFGPHGNRVATGSYAFATGNFLQIWDPITGERIQTFPAVTIPVQSLAFSPDGGRVATIGVDESVRAWDSSTGQRLMTFREPGAKASVPIRSQSQRRTWVKQLQLGYGAIAYAPDGRSVAISDGHTTITIHDARTGQLMRSLEGHSQRVVALAFSPDGREIASGGEDRTIRIWEVASGRVIHTLSAHTAPVYGLAFSPDGRTLASVGGDFQKFGSSGEAFLWSSVTGRLKSRLRGHTEVVSGAAFSPDGRRLATASLDRTIKLWDTSSGQEVFTLRGHANGVICVAFSSDGQRIVSGSTDETAKVWDTSEPSAEQLLRRVASDLVIGLYQTHLLKTGVIEQIRRDPKLDESLRRLALELARRSTEDPNLLNDTSWYLARDPKRGHQDYLRAARYAEVACALAPDDSSFLDTRGAARYRAGRFREALVDLGRSPGSATTGAQSALPARLAFLAMAERQLGQRDLARRTLAQLRAAMRTPPWSSDAESKALFVEAAALIGEGVD
jgi:WD40 repeat protein/tRNA A-37 threonylcarbamoyl transferase component Bud32